MAPNQDVSNLYLRKKLGRERPDEVEPHSINKYKRTSDLRKSRPVVQTVSSVSQEPERSKSGERLLRPSVMVDPRLVEPIATQRSYRSGEGGMADPRLHSTRFVDSSRKSPSGESLNRDV